MKQPFSLVHKRTSRNTSEASKTIAKDADEGRSIGMAAVVMYLYPEPHFVTYITDEAERNPVFTSGMLASLNYELMQKVRR